MTETSVCVGWGANALPRSFKVYVRNYYYCRYSFYLFKNYNLCTSTNRLAYNCETQRHLIVGHFDMGGLICGSLTPQIPLNYYISSQSSTNKLTATKRGLSR